MFQLFGGSSHNPFLFLLALRRLGDILLLTKISLFPVLVNFDVIVLNLFNGLDLRLVEEVGLFFLFFLFFGFGLDVVDAGLDNGFKLSGG